MGKNQSKSESHRRSSISETNGEESHERRGSVDIRRDQESTKVARATSADVDTLSKKGKKKVEKEKKKQESRSNTLTSNLSSSPSKSAPVPTPSNHDDTEELKKQIKDLQTQLESSQHNVTQLQQQLQQKGSSNNRVPYQNELALKKEMDEPKGAPKEGHQYKKVNTVVGSMIWLVSQNADQVKKIDVNDNTNHQHVEESPVKVPESKQEEPVAVPKIESESSSEPTSSKNEEINSALKGRQENIINQLEQIDERISKMEK